MPSHFRLLSSFWEKVGVIRRRRRRNKRGGNVRRRIAIERLCSVRVIV